VKLGKRKLRCAIDRHEKVELTLPGTNLGDVDVKVADWVAFERLLGNLVAGDLRKPADAVTLEASMQGRPGQVRNGRLQGIEAVVERQQRMLAEGDDDSLFLGRQDCRARSFRGTSLTKARLRHLATVLWFSPYCAASSLSGAFDRCIAARTACVV